MTKKQILQTLEEIYELQHRKRFLIACLFFDPEDLEQIRDDLKTHELLEGSVGRLDNIAVYEIARMELEAAQMEPLKIDNYCGIHYAYIKVLAVD